MKHTPYCLTLCLSVLVPTAQLHASGLSLPLDHELLAYESAADEVEQEFTSSGELSKIAFRGVAPSTDDDDPDDLSAQEQAALKRGFLDNDRLKKLALEEELQSVEDKSYGPAALDLSGRSLFRFKAYSDENALQELYGKYGQSAPLQARIAPIPDQFWTRSNFYNDYLGYILRFENLPHNLLEIPAVFTTGDDFNFKIFTDIIKEGPLTGMGLIQARLQNLQGSRASDAVQDLRVQTPSAGYLSAPVQTGRSDLPSADPEYSLVQYSLPSEQIVTLGTYRGFKSSVPRNHGTIDYGALQTAVMARLLGLSSQTGRSGLLPVISSFDHLLYAPALGRRIEEGDSLQSLVQRCDFSEGPCGLYAQGPYAVTLQEQDLCALDELNHKRGLAFAGDDQNAPALHKDNAYLTLSASAESARISSEDLKLKHRMQIAAQESEPDPNAFYSYALQQSAEAEDEFFTREQPKHLSNPASSSGSSDRQKGLPGRHEQANARLNNPSDVPHVEDEDRITLNLNDKNPGGINRAYESYRGGEDYASQVPDDWSWVQYSRLPDRRRTEEKGLEVLLEPYGKIYVNLDHTLLSDTGYINYPVLVPQELALLSDLGYKIDIKEFYGNALTRSGSLQERLTYVNSQGYGLYEEGSLNLKLPSQVPLGTGFLAMTSHSDLTQQGNILSEGQGSVGVRVDGSFNTLTVPEDASIRMNGPGSAGIAFTYGRFNALSLDGTVRSHGRDSIGLLCDFGSNLYSNLKEYRGSYQRNSTLLGRDLPLLPELDGPLLSKINIGGTLQGDKAAILISPSAMVEEINVTGQAVIRGDIISLFTPVLSEDGNYFVIKTDVTGTMRDPLIQLPSELIAEDTHHGLRSIAEHLNTKLRLGPVRKDVQRGKAQTVAGDPNANILIDGNILGQNLAVDAMGGKIEVLGQVRAWSLKIENAILRLDSDETAHQLRRLLLGKNGILDLANGKRDLVVVTSGMAAGENACVKVDANLSSEILDKIEIRGDLRSRFHQLKVEPGLKYDDLRRLQSSPMLMLSFISDFVRNVNKILMPHGMTAAFPEHVWDSGGGFGREIRCTGRGCRIGAFVRNDHPHDQEELHPWRYVLSALGLLLIIAGTYVYFAFQRNQHRIRD